MPEIRVFVDADGTLDVSLEESVGVGVVATDGRVTVAGLADVVAQAARPNVPRQATKNT